MQDYYLEESDYQMLAEQMEQEDGASYPIEIEEAGTNCVHCAYCGASNATVFTE